jgi:hypothetical protein
VGNDPFVDRRPEVAAFRDALESDQGGQALIVWGAEGYGKTHLIEEFRRMAGERENIESCKVDLKGQPGAHAKSIMEEICDQMEGCEFTHFDRAAQALLQSPVPTTFQSQMPAPGTLAAESRAVSERQIRMLTQALLNDLNKAYKDTSKVVILIDHCETSAQARFWVEETLLPKIKNCPPLILVVAHRDRLASSKEDEEPRRLYLDPMRETQDWVEYARKLDIDISPGEIARIIQRCHGWPFDIAFYLRTRRRRPRPGGRTTDD